VSPSAEPTSEEMHAGCESFSPQILPSQGTSGRQACCLDVRCGQITLSLGCRAVGFVDRSVHDSRRKAGYRGTCADAQISIEDARARVSNGRASEHYIAAGGSQSDGIGIRTMPMTAEVRVMEPTNERRAISYCPPRPARTVRCSSSGAPFSVERICLKKRAAVQYCSIFRIIFRLRGLCS
jgi:hypothetical protein